MTSKRILTLALIFSLGVTAACGTDSADDRNLSFSKTTTTVKTGKTTTTLALKPTGSSSGPSSTAESDTTPESDMGGQSDIDPASFGNGPGLPTGGSAGTANLMDCYDAILGDPKYQDESKNGTISHVTTLVAMYSEANNGIIDCSDGSRLWEEIMDWVTKLINVKVPSPELVHYSYAPFITLEDELSPLGDIIWNEGLVVWDRDRFGAGFAPPEPGFIYAYDIDEETGVGTPWIHDHIAYRVRPCTESRFTEFTEIEGRSFVYQYAVSERAYRDDDPMRCVDVETISYGVHLDGSPSEYTLRAGPRRFELKNLVKDDKFVVVGFGDSYGSGEGNPASDTRWVDRSFFASDEDTMANPESLFWPEGDLEEFGVNTSAHDQCHRSSESGLGKAIASLGEDYTGEILYGHFACSGAVSFDVFASPYTPDFWGFERQQDPQIEQALRWLSERNSSPREVDAVVISVGGNDVGFADVIYDCFIEAGDCYNEDDTRALRRVIPSRISARGELVGSVVAQLFPNAEIFFTAYTDGIGVSRSNPKDLDNDGACSYDDDPWFGEVEWDDDEFWDILAVDSRWIVGFVNDLNGQLVETTDSLNSGSARSISRNIELIYSNSSWMRRFMAERYPDIYLNMSGGYQRTHIIDSQFTDFRNNGFCAGSSRRNIMFNAEAGRRQGNDQAHYWSSGGWHPNDYGYELYGDAIAAALIETFPEQTRNLQSPR